VSTRLKAQRKNAKYHEVLLNFLLILIYIKLIWVSHKSLLALLKHL